MSDSAKKIATFEVSEASVKAIDALADAMREEMPEQGRPVYVVIMAMTAPGAVVSGSAIGGCRFITREVTGSPVEQVEAAKRISLRALQACVDAATQFGEEYAMRELEEAAETCTCKACVMRRAIEKAASN